MCKNETVLPTYYTTPISGSEVTKTINTGTMDFKNPENLPQNHTMKRNFENATYTYLALAEQGLYPAKIAKLHGLNRSTVLRRFASMERAGLLKKTNRSTTNFYQLTKQGQDLLKEIRKGFNNATCEGVKRYHHLMARFPVLTGELSSEQLQARGFSFFKHGCVSGFALRLKEGRLMWARKSFLFFPEPIYAASFYDAVMKFFDLSEFVAKKVNVLFPWVRVHDRAEIVRQHLAASGGIAKWIPEKFRFNGDALLIDFSKGEAEIETYGGWGVEGWLNIASGLDDMAQGKVEERIKRLESFILEVKGSLDELKRVEVRPRDLRDVV